MVPEVVRATQPELAFVPLVRLKFKSILVMIGERSITVANPAPYLGWADFKPLIVEVFTVLLKSNLVSRIDRYSLKYTNVLKENEERIYLTPLNYSLKIGTFNLTRRPT